MSSKISLMTPFHWTAEQKLRRRWFWAVGSWWLTRCLVERLVTTGLMIR